MITKIDIQSMGVFQNFLWDQNVISNNKNDLRHINIFYGRNYSGKTTLSRIFRALETGTLPKHFEDAQFTLYWEKNGMTTTPSNLSVYGQTVRVFNRDFIRENLSFLSDTSTEGQVNSFAVLGADNLRIEEEIRGILSELGSSEEGKESGLFLQLRERSASLKKTTEMLDNVKKSFEKLKKEEATGEPNGIKYRSDLYGDQNYTISKLNKDIEIVLRDEYIAIDGTQKQNYEKIVSETIKPAIPQPNIPQINFSSLCEKVKKCVEMQITSSVEIQELAADLALREWAKNGMKLHQYRRTSCAFCGNEISDSRWHTLNRYFDEASTNLEKEITSLIEDIKAHKESVCKWFGAQQTDFYTSYQARWETLFQKHSKFFDQYGKYLDELVQQLKNRLENIAKNFSFIFPEVTFNTFNDLVVEYETLRKESNEYTLNIDKRKKEAREKLRLHQVKSFIETHNYLSTKGEIEKFNEQKSSEEELVKQIEGIIDSKTKELENLKRKLNDEEKGAERINSLLTQMGQQFLELKAIADENDTISKKVHFEIFRGGKRAYNLSEGECSLIAFCYFIAKLEDAETKDKKPIIWIDDPICSLDGNHIFFVYSLLRAKIVDKDNFEQLFISTHSLEFLRFLKQLYNKSSGGKKNQTWLIIEREKDCSIIKILPNYLKDYVTEFNYLFHQIWKCSQIKSVSDENYHLLYSFGNHARKFLEIYMYYKYPDCNTDKVVRFSELFGDDVSGFLVDRVNNEGSHLCSSVERGASPVDIPEIVPVAQKILDAIKRTDKCQYTALLASIGVKQEEKNESNPS